jgi:hypothetical protein
MLLVYAANATAEYTGAACHAVTFVTAIPRHSWGPQTRPGQQNARRAHFNLAQTARDRAFWEVATKKNPKQDTRLGVWSLLPHLGFWGGRHNVGDGVPPDLV